MWSLLALTSVVRDCSYFFLEAHIRSGSLVGILIVYFQKASNRCPLRHSRQMSLVEELTAADGRIQR